MQLSLNKNKEIKCNYTDDFNGNVIDTFRVELQKKSPINYDRGNIGAGLFLYPQTTGANDATINGIFDSIVYSNNSSGSYYAGLAGGALYSVNRANFGTNHFVKITGAGTPSAISGDVIVFGQTGGLDNLIVPSQTDLSALISNVWTATWWTVTLGQSALVSTYAHATAIFKQPFLLLISDSNNLHTVDQANNVMYQRLSLPTYHIIRWIRTTEDRVYLGVKDINGGYPGVYEYDPVNETAYFTSIDALGAEPGAPVIDQGVLIILCADGRFRQFGSGKFTIIAETPYSKRISATGAINFHRNCAFPNNNSYYFLLPDSSIQTAGTWAGLYVYDKTTQNFYHNKAISYTSADAGQMILNSTGALFSDGQNMIGSIADYTSGTQTGLYTDSTNYGTGASYRGWVITPKIQANDIQDIWHTLWLKYFISGSDTILPKMRNNRIPDIIPVNGVSSATWTSTTTLTTGVSLSVSLIGMELTVVYGTGSGFTSKIANIVGTTVTITDTIGANSGTLYYWIDDFQPLLQITSTGQTSGSVGTIDGINKGEWVQLKIELQGSSAIIEDIILDTENNLTL